MIRGSTSTNAARSPTGINGRFHSARSRCTAAMIAHAQTAPIARLGELIHAQKATVGLAKGGQPYRRRSTGSKKEPVEKATLADAGIDKKLSMRAQRLATMTAPAFDRNPVIPEQPPADWSQRAPKAVGTGSAVRHMRIRRVSLFAPGLKVA